MLKVAPFPVDLRLVQILTANRPQTRDVKYGTTNNGKLNTLTTKTNCDTSIKRPFSCCRGVVPSLLFASRLQFLVGFQITGPQSYFTLAERFNSVGSCPFTLLQASVRKYLIKKQKSILIYLKRTINKLFLF